MRNAVSRCFVALWRAVRGAVFRRGIRASCGCGCVVCDLLWRWGVDMLSNNLQALFDIQQHAILLICINHRQIFRSLTLALVGATGPCAIAGHANDTATPDPEGCPGVHLGKICRFGPQLDQSSACRRRCVPVPSSSGVISFRRASSGTGSYH